MENDLKKADKYLLTHQEQLGKNQLKTTLGKFLTQTLKTWKVLEYAPFFTKVVDKSGLFPKIKPLTR